MRAHGHTAEINHHRKVVHLHMSMQPFNFPAGNWLNLFAFLCLLQRQWEREAATAGSRRCLRGSAAYTSFSCLRLGMASSQHFWKSGLLQFLLQVSEELFFLTLHISIKVRVSLRLPVHWCILDTFVLQQKKEKNRREKGCWRAPTGTSTYGY